MISRLVAACARNPLPTIAIAAALSLWGWYAMRAAPLDAIPDLSDTQVIVLTEWPGQSPDLVESQVTYPVPSSKIT